MKSTMTVADFRIEAPKTTQIFSRELDARVVMRGDMAGINAEGTIYLPALPETSTLSPEEADAMRGYIDHEAAHKRYTPLPRYFRQMDQHHADKTPEKNALMNAMEDMRIEGKALKDYIGAAQNIDATALKVIDNISGQVFENGWPEDPRAYFPLAITMAGRIANGFPSSHVMRQFLDDLPCQKTRKLAEKYGKAAAKAQSFDAILKQVDAAYEEAGYEGPPEEEDGEQGENQPQDPSPQGNSGESNDNDNGDCSNDREDPGDGVDRSGGEGGSPEHDDPGADGAGAEGPQQPTDSDGAGEGDEPGDGDEHGGEGSDSPASEAGVDDEAGQPPGSEGEEADHGELGDGGPDSGDDADTGRQPVQSGAPDSADDSDAGDGAGMENPQEAQGSGGGSREDRGADQDDGEDGAGAAQGQGQADGSDEESGGEGGEGSLGTGASEDPFGKRYDGDTFKQDLTQVVKQMAADKSSEGLTIYSDECDVIGDVNTDRLANAITYYRFHRRHSYGKHTKMVHSAARATARAIIAGEKPLWGEGHAYAALNKRLEESYQESLDELQGKVAVIASRLERLLKGIAPRRWASGHRQGRLDPRRLSQAYQGGERVWQGRQPKVFTDTSVIMLVDLSGSMTQNKKDVMAQHCAVALSEALERTAVRYQVMGFRELELGPKAEGVILPEYRRAWHYNTALNRIDPPDFDTLLSMRRHSRLMAMSLPIYKPFDKPLRQCRLGMGAIQCDQVEGCNPDSHAIRAALKMLCDTESTRKVLITLSDGEPAMHGVESGIADDDLKRAIKECEAEGVQCLGIGIKSPAVKTYYPRHAIVNDLSELATTVMDELAQALTGQVIREAV